MDYFGLMKIKNGRRMEKNYGALFTCLPIRAVHLKLVDSLYADSAILAIRKFIAKRGYSIAIWSDYGINFTSAN